MTAPRGADAFARFEVIGGAFAAGAQSGGLVASTQREAWPALIAAAVGVDFAQAVHRAPGCAPPLAGPLILGVRLSGTSITGQDSSCTTPSTPFVPPGNNLAIGDASAWDARHLTPKAIAGAAAGTFDLVTRSRYKAVLALTQSQVTAMLVSQPTFVAVDLGLGDVTRAATSGHVVTASAYGAPADWTFAPSAVVIPEVDAIADSVAKSGAKAVILSMPTVTRFPAFARAADVWSEASALQAFGVIVGADCQSSPNLVNVQRLMPALAIQAAAAGATQALSCADVPGSADGILTEADVAAIEAATDEINGHLQAMAIAHGWAFADLGAAYDAMAAASGPYSADAQLTCTVPYGTLLSLDGINPSAAGQRRIADVVATAINTRYGFALPVVGDSLDLQVPPCGSATARAIRDAGAVRSSFVRETRFPAKDGPRHGARGWLH